MSSSTPDQRRVPKKPASPSRPPRAESTTRAFSRPESASAGGKARRPGLVGVRQGRHGGGRGQSSATDTLKRARARARAHPACTLPRTRGRTTTYACVFTHTKPIIIEPQTPPHSPPTHARAPIHVQLREAIERSTREADEEKVRKSQVRKHTDILEYSILLYVTDIPSVRFVHYCTHPTPMCAKLGISPGPHNHCSLSNPLQ